MTPQTIENKMQALDKAYQMERMAIASRNNPDLEPIPFYWEFENFCKENGISCTYDEVKHEYYLVP